MRSTERGTRNAKVGTKRRGRLRSRARPDVPRSAFRLPRFLTRAPLLALLAPPARAQQPDSVPTDTLAPVVVTGVRLPTVRELARGLTGRTANLNAGDLDARGVRPRAGALAQLPGVPTSFGLGPTRLFDGNQR